MDKRIKKTELEILSEMKIDAQWSINYHSKKISKNCKNTTFNDLDTEDQYDVTWHSEKLTDFATRLDLINELIKLKS